MKVYFFTIVLDGMPFITHHLPVFNRLSFDWEWRIVEGVALPENCTRWCGRIDPRISMDGTAEYLREIAYHPCVRVCSRTAWAGKIEMVREATKDIPGGSLVVEVDSDELWDDGSLSALYRRMLRAEEGTEARFFCRYFVGHDLIVNSINTYGNKPDEWVRAWKWGPESRFESHEPPVVSPRSAIIHRETTVADSIFDHYAYATEKQLAFKETYYRYHGAVEGWKRLQRQTVFPVRLSEFFPWVKDGATVIRCSNDWLPF